MTNAVTGNFITRSFPALKHRNFRLFWTGQCISLIGTWMQNIGQSWLVLELTHSALKLSLITMMQFLPMMTLSLFFGTLVDKFPKRKVLIFTQTSMLILALILATLTYFNVVEYWHVLILALALGIVNTLDMPTRQSYFSELVERKDLMNAIALNSSIFNLARIVGPAIAGIMIGWIGIAVCFYLNALSYVAVIVGLWMITTPVQPLTKMSSNILISVVKDAKEGIGYIMAHSLLKRTLILLAIMSVFVMNFSVLIPIFAEQTLGLNATGYGLLMTSMGLGSFIGAMTLAVRSKSGPRFSFLLAGGWGTSLFLGFLGTQMNLVVITITLFLVGFCSIMFTALVNSTLQLNTEDKMRGRVMSMYALLFGGLTPIGSLYAGLLMENYGAPGCMIISGVIGVIAVSIAILQHRKRQPKQQILPSA